MNWANRASLMRVYGSDVEMVTWRVRYEQPCVPQKAGRELHAYNMRRNWLVCEEAGTIWLPHAGTS